MFWYCLWSSVCISKYAFRCYINYIFKWNLCCLVFVFVLVQWLQQSRFVGHYTLNSQMFAETRRHGKWWVKWLNTRRPRRMGLELGMDNGEEMLCLKIKCKTESYGFTTTMTTGICTEHVYMKLWIKRMFSPLCDRLPHLINCCCCMCLLYGFPTYQMFVYLFL